MIFAIWLRSAKCAADYITPPQERKTNNLIKSDRAIQRLQFVDTFREADFSGLGFPEVIDCANYGK